MIEPVLPNRAEQIELERVFERLRLVLDPRRNVQHLALTHGNLFAGDQKLERALQDVGHLLALVRMIRDDAAALQVDLREHLALAGDDLPREHFSNFFEGDLVPAMETNRLRGHGRRAYTNTAGCYKLAYAMKAVLNGRDAQVFDALDRGQLLAVHRVMLLARKLDDKKIQLKNQSQIFFQISGAGHEAITTAAALTLKSGYDWFFPYSRDRALCRGLGVTPLEMLLAAVGAKDDPASGGRQMPSHWGHTQHNIVSGSSPTGTQVLHAVGAAEAGVIYSRVPQIPDRDAHHHADEITYVSLGEGATSEGEFWESLNVTCAKKLPVLFLVEDNGYAISVPVDVQTAGGDISRLVASFPGLLVDSIAGRDCLVSLRTMRKAAEYVRARKGPAFVHARVIRPYSHSLSDDEKLYKPPAEREAEARRDPIVRFAQFLTTNGLATADDF